MVDEKALKDALKLNKFKYIWIQKVIGISQPIFLITIDSRYPDVYLGFKTVKNSKAAALTSMKKHGLGLLAKKVKLTPPLSLKNASFTIGTNAIVILRDIAGDYFHNPKMFENNELTKKGIKLIEVKNGENREN